MNITRSLVGQRYGCVVVVHDSEAETNDRKVRVRCDCGEESLVTVRILIRSGGRKWCSVSGCTDRRRLAARKASA